MSYRVVFSPDAVRVYHRGRDIDLDDHQSDPGA